MNHPKPTANPAIESILAFWFGEVDGPADVDSSKSTIWWGGNDALDAEISERFGDLVRAARDGELDAWCETPRGTLALVILLDQFSRNVFRGTGEAFAADDRALQTTLEAMEQGFDRELRLIERAFLYMPMMHAEDRTMAERSVAAFTALSEEIRALQREDFPDFSKHAKQHADIVARFGRYPHRNTLLGRSPTAEEEAFLADGGPTFGQTKR